jgi:hypothetical protein
MITDLMDKAYEFMPEDGPWFDGKLALENVKIRPAYTGQRDPNDDLSWGCPGDGDVFESSLVNASVHVCLHSPLLTANMGFRILRAIAQISFLASV